ncbi:MAG TPA: hypothetical protein VIM98_07555 [Dyella sp.]|uniref:hypothetical protein n=1 Tax=Dyella sp. TaxID=1869338 RepID=UPI002F933D2A
MTRDDDEWQVQEHALQRERSGAGPAGDDAQVRRYRAIARALRQAPPDLLPADFASRVAERARRSDRESSWSPRLENSLLTVLMILLGCGLAVLASLQGRDWLSAIEGLGFIANPWMYALLACVAISQGIALLRPTPRLH